MTHPDLKATRQPPPQEQPDSPAGASSSALPGSATAPEPHAATFRQVAGAVFWSFFGVRKGRHMQRDLAIKPLHVLIVGLLGGLMFVLALVALVSFITRGAP